MHTVASGMIYPLINLLIYIFILHIWNNAKFEVNTTLPHTCKYTSGHHHTELKKQQVPQQMKEKISFMSFSITHLWTFNLSNTLKNHQLYNIHNNIHTSIKSFKIPELSPHISQKYKLWHNFYFTHTHLYICAFMLENDFFH